MIAGSRLKCERVVLLFKNNKQDANDGGILVFFFVILKALIKEGTSLSVILKSGDSFCHSERIEESLKKKGVFVILNAVKNLNP